MPAIETARLRLRCFTERDLEDYVRIFADPEYTRYSPKGSVPLEQVREAAQAAYNYFTYHWQQHGFGVWAICDRVNHKLIGQCGLNCLPDSHEVEVLYRLDRAYWNQGLATEATKASLRYASAIRQNCSVDAATPFSFPVRDGESWIALHERCPDLRIECSLLYITSSRISVR